MSGIAEVRRTVSRFCVIVLVAVTLSATVKGQPGASQIITATGIEAGLAVLVGVGSTDLLGIHNNGRMVVAALCANAAELSAAQSKVASDGIHGLVTIHLPLSLKEIPFATNTVNLVIADLDKLGTAGPSVSELQRVLAPYGKAYYNLGGWKTLTKPVPSTMDDWPTFFGKANNTLPDDKEVHYADRLRWIGAGSLGGTNGPQGMILGSGMMYKRRRYKDIRVNKDVFCFEGRSAFNGVPIWAETDRDLTLAAIVDGKVFSAAAGTGKFQGRDILTGELLYTLDQAGQMSSLYDSDGVCQISGFGQIVLIPNGKDLWAFNTRNGSLLWKHTARDKAILEVIADSASGTVFLAEGVGAQRMGRWHGGPLNFLVALNAQTGAEKWRVNSWVGTGPGTREYPNITKLIYQEGYVYVFGACGIIAAYGDPFLARINAGTGSVEYTTHYQDDISKYKPSRFGANAGIFDGTDFTGTSYWTGPGPTGGEQAFTAQTAYIWGGEMILAQAQGINAYDPAKGTKTRTVWSMSQGQCNRTLGTKNYLYGHSTITLSTDGTILKNWITRSGCANGGVPAYGALHFESGWCSCFPFVHGMLSLSSDPQGDPIVSDKRTDNPGIAAVGTVKSSPFAASNIIVREWYDVNRIFLENTYGSGTYVAYQNENRVARKVNGSDTWSFIAGGRITHAPIEQNGKVYFGSHDGWVYAVDANSGALVWRALAAPRDEKVVAFGQVESRWPVLGVAIQGSNIVAVAGRHSEMDGGIWVFAFDQQSGKVNNWVQLYSPPIKTTTEKESDRSTRLLPSFEATGKKSISCYGIENRSGQIVILNSIFNKGAFRSTSSTRLYTGPSTSGLAVDLAAWNGKKIDPRTQNAVSVERQRQQESFRRGGPLGAAANTPVQIELYDMQERVVGTLSTSASPATARIPSTTGAVSRGYYLVRRKTTGMSTSTSPMLVW